MFLGAAPTSQIIRKGSHFTIFRLQTITDKKRGSEGKVWSGPSGYGSGCSKCEQLLSRGDVAYFEASIASVNLYLVDILISIYPVKALEVRRGFYSTATNC